MKHIAPATIPFFTPSSRESMMRVETMEPIIAVMQAINAGLGSISFDFVYLKSDALVPKRLCSLLQPYAISSGIPVSRYAGSEMIPPPPEMPSIKPARNKSGQTINKSINKFKIIPPIPLDYTSKVCYNQIYIIDTLHKKKL